MTAPIAPHDVAPEQQPESTSAKPRARLGPTEVVVLPNSDSEDDNDDDRESARIEDVEGDPEDFLKLYPAETEVCRSDGPADGLLTAGAATAASPAEDAAARLAAVQPVQPAPQTPVPEAKRRDVADPRRGFRRARRAGGD